MLVTSAESIVSPVVDAIQQQLSELSRKDITAKALEHSRIIVLKDEQEVIAFTNMYAPEHLIIQTENLRSVAEQIENAGKCLYGTLHS